MTLNYCLCYIYLEKAGKKFIWIPQMDNGYIFYSSRREAISDLKFRFKGHRVRKTSGSTYEIRINV